MPFFAALAPMIAGKAMEMANKDPGKLGVSSPVDRRMEQVSADPNNVLKEGKAALAQADAQTRTALEPVIDEAIKKSAQQKQQQGAY